MSRKMLGVVVSLAISVVVFIISRMITSVPSIINGICVGLALALAQSWISIVAMDLAWEKKYFYWVWGGGMFFRMAVFAMTAFVVYRSTSLSFIATMVSMVMTTTLFLVLESQLFFGKR